MSITQVARSGVAGLDRRQTSKLLDIIEADHTDRAATERFVEDCFAHAFDARIRTHYPTLIRLSGTTGLVRAACGVRFAEDGPLFLERYLDQGVEEELYGLLADDIHRAQIVEIGSLAALSPVAAVCLFQKLAEWLAVSQGRRVAVATLRPELSALLEKAGCGLIPLGMAAANRVQDDMSDWGTYYDAEPAVFAGLIGGEPTFRRQTSRSRQAA